MIIYQKVFYLKEEKKIELKFVWGLNGPDVRSITRISVLLLLALNVAPKIRAMSHLQLISDSLDCCRR